MRRIINGEVFLVLFLLSGFYKVEFIDVFKIDPTALFLSLSIACAIIKLYKEPYFLNEATIPMTLYLAISFLMILGLFTAIGNPYAYSKTINFLVITGWSFLGPFLLTSRTNPNQSMKRYLMTFVLVGLIMVINSIINQPSEQTMFVTSFGSNYLSLGKMSAIVALLGLSYVLLVEGKKLTKFVIITATFLCIYTLLISGGRMPVIAFVVCLIILILMGVNVSRLKFGDIRIKKKTIAFSFVGLLLMPIVINYLNLHGNVFLYRLALLLNEGGRSATNRLDNFSESINMIKESKLLGMGVGSFHAYTGFLGDRSYPHNLFLEVFSELGAIGAILITTLMLLALYRYFKFYFDKDSFFSVSLFILFVYAFINAQVSGDLNDNRMLFFFVSLLCLSKTLSNKDKVIIQSEHTMRQ